MTDRNPYMDGSSGKRLLVASIVLAVIVLLTGAYKVSAAMVGGTASWYDDGPGLYAAVPSFSFGDARYDLKVCRQDDGKTCVTVTVRDHCNCYVGTDHERLIDLSPDAFRVLEPRIGTSTDPGLIAVFFETAPPDEVALTPPPTDTDVGSGGAVHCAIPL